ncbi:phage tail protein [Paludibacterium purpuratum]|uniref:Putative tail protein n=1 Tax=Paludibacterium purpuratum TaxID=1144873 RepID=A0A4R7BDZ2_9NEIS|nr:phage tail protein [Paludibacterium purpuratum]TDR82215.1 putative tail protein [Paludibacterium purpuratum]
MSGLFGGAKTPQSQTPSAVSDLSVQTSSFGKVVPLMWGTNRVTGNLIWYGNFQSHAHQSSGQSGGKGGGGGGGGGTTSYTYSTSWAMGLTEGQIQNIGNVYASKAVGSTSSYGLSVFPGVTPQAPWSYLTSAFPSLAIGYSGLAYIAAANFDLGSNTSLPNFSFEIFGPLAYSFTGSQDAPPAAVMQDFLTNSYYGALFPSSKIGDQTAWDNFTKAAGLLVSPVLDTAAEAHQFIDELCTVTCSAAVPGAESLRIVPYADVPITGNGVTFTPSVAPAYDLTDDDFLDDGSTDPVVMNRGNSADAYNSVTVEYLDRTNQYNAATVTAQDQANIDLFGLRPSPTMQMHMITSAAIAQQAAQFALQRSCYVRNTYQFKLGWRYILLEPMDVVTINDAFLGLNKYPVRITEIDEDNDTGDLTFTAEDFPDHVSTPSLNAVQGGSSYATNLNTPPGSVNQPVIFDAPGVMTASGFEVWAAVSGGSNFGGCNVWVSEDGNTYVKVGAIHGSARHGVLSASLATGTDPDTSNALAIDLSVSNGQLISGTQADADRFNTLCLVGSELISYQTATLTGVNRYSLSYLRRGIYNSKSGAHAAGENFVRLDASVFKYAYDRKLLGSTIYLKFTAFNLYGGGEQSLADCTAYPYVVGGSISRPPNVTGFTASQNGNVVVMQWNSLSSIGNIAGYDIRYAPAGDAVWAHGTPVTQATAGTLITTATLPPGSWVLMICAVDTSGVYSATPATFQFAMQNVNSLLAKMQQDPDWLSRFTAGQVSNFVYHWTGKLVPQSQGVAANDGWSTFDSYVPNPYPLCTYQAPEIDLGSDGPVRIHGDIVSVLGPGAPGIAAPGLQIDTRTSTGQYGGFTPWTIGTLTCRYIKLRIAADSTVGLPVITGFSPTVDGEQISQSGQVTVPVGGVTIAFARQYHMKPIPQATTIGGTGLMAVVTTVSTASMTIKVFDTTDTDVGGTATWSADGV